MGDTISQYFSSLSLKLKTSARKPDCHFYSSTAMYLFNMEGTYKTDESHWFYYNTKHIYLWLISFTL